MQLIPAPTPQFTVITCVFALVHSPRFPSPPPYCQLLFSLILDEPFPSMFFVSISCNSILKPRISCTTSVTNYYVRSYNSPKTRSKITHYFWKNVSVAFACFLVQDVRPSLEYMWCDLVKASSTRQVITKAFFNHTISAWKDLKFPFMSLMICTAIRSSRLIGYRLGGVLVVVTWF